MLKPTVKRGLMLDFIPEKIQTPSNTDPNRVYKLNNKPLNDGDIVYFPTRELRLEDNWAVMFGLELAKMHSRTFKIIVIPGRIKYSDMQYKFLMAGLERFKNNALKYNIDFLITDKLPDKIGALITDFNAVNPYRVIHDCAVFEVDSHNIIPARFVSDKQEYSAATLRRKIYANISNFLTEYSTKFDEIKNPALDKLNLFMNSKLTYYAEYKNDINRDVTSHMSPYLHFGFISSQKIALEVIKSNVTRENKEAFLEELIVRKELADNFCLYSESYTTFKNVPEWAKITLNAHENDIRAYIYSSEEFEDGKTHDSIWNKIQNELTATGYMHGYVRMYWAKKILEWSKSPNEALRIAIYLNDKYALDGNDSNGYVGILWSIGGLHDRPFTNRLVVGKIRYMGVNKINFEKD